jgi:hypothetical protein
MMLVASSAFGQSVEMADAFRADGKIYVVVAIVLIVLFGLIAYLFMLDRKLTRLERGFQEKNQTKETRKAF